jgi:hypothetical protein
LLAAPLLEVRAEEVEVVDTKAADAAKAAQKLAEEEEERYKNGGHFDIIVNFEADCESLTKEHERPLNTVVSAMERRTPQLRLHLISCCGPEEGPPICKSRLSNVQNYIASRKAWPSTATTEIGGADWVRPRWLA